ncbi:WD repeat-containing protein 76 [Mucuna pruriens]|uniref:WD repeat-containing protein 76 n=1 Tax=Mucuna pruriens TaxID=157652 RepID=A0A371HLM2_MUCPR|nr:WD repeat-containing protein 76 [Mucuna pruriens]
MRSLNQEMRQNFAEGAGGLTIWDNRIGKRSSYRVLHKRRINTIDFNCENPHIVATSSSDGTACTWDLRHINGDKPIPLRIVTHKRGVQSAYFSPSGCSLATTSVSSTIGIYSGVNLEDAARLDNIRRNDEMMAALKLHSKAIQLSNSKRQRVGTKSYTVKSEKKPKIETPIVVRRSLRTRGIPPASKGLDGDTVDSTTPAKTEPSVESLGPLSMADACESTPSGSSFVESLVGLAQKEAQAPHSIREKLGSGKGKVEASLGLESLYLDPESIARVVPGRITNVRFFPSSSVKMVAVGNKFGNVGFWNVGESDVHLYRPHRAPISGILIQPHCLSKIYTSCYDGILRLMDAEKEIFDLVFESDKSIYTLSQRTNEANCLYLAEGSGGLTIWDNRIGKRSSNWVLHEKRINTIDFNCENPHIVATSSSDGTACTWDLRYIDEDKLTALRTFTHERSVQSAYFSPSGHSLTTTSLDDTIGIYSGVNLEDEAVIYHNNQTGRWLSTFRAKWGWDDSYLFVGNMKRGVDIVSAVQRKIVMTLESPHISAIPCRFDTHSYEVGTLVGATSGGQVYIWTSR